MLPHCRFKTASSADDADLHRLEIEIRDYPLRKNKSKESTRGQTCTRALQVDTQGLAPSLLHPPYPQSHATLTLLSNPHLLSWPNHAEPGWTGMLACHH